jgi:hypothetical protein
LDVAIRMTPVEAEVAVSICTAPAETCIGEAQEAATTLPETSVTKNLLLAETLTVAKLPRPSFTLAEVAVDALVPPILTGTSPDQLPAETVVRLVLNTARVEAVSQYTMALVEAVIVVPVPEVFLKVMVWFVWLSTMYHLS